MNLKGCLGFLLPGIPSPCTGQSSCLLCHPQQAGDSPELLTGRVLHSLPELPANTLRFASQLLSNRICHVFLLSGSTGWSFFLLQLPCLPVMDRFGWMGQVARVERALFPQQAVPEKSISFFPFAKKKKRKKQKAFLTNPVHFNIITFIPQIKMLSFCQTPAHYSGFSSFSEGFTFEILSARMLVNSWA